MNTIHVESNILLAPYGQQQLETSSLHLIARYLTEQGVDIQKLIFDGATTGDLSEHVGFAGILESVKKISDQKKYAQWSGCKLTMLSDFLSAQDSVKTKRWVMQLDQSDLKSVSVEGVSLEQMLVVAKLELTKANLIAAWHSLLIAQKTILRLKPQIAILAQGNDLITQSFLQTLITSKIRTVGLSLNDKESILTVSDSSSEQDFSLEVYRGDLFRLPSDSNRWPTRIIEEVKAVCNFLRMYKEEGRFGNSERQLGLG